MVVALISLVYGIFFSSKLLNSVEKKIIDLSDLKSTLKKYEFEKEIMLKCTDIDFKCFVLVDGVFKEELKDKLFTQKADVYSYEERMQKREFLDFTLENMESYPIFFSYKIDRYGKSDDMIVDTKDGIYLFNSILTKPIKFETLNKASEYFTNQEKKVRDVF